MATTAPALGNVSNASNHFIDFHNPTQAPQHTESDENMHHNTVEIELDEYNSVEATTHLQDTSPTVSQNENTISQPPAITVSLVSSPQQYDDNHDHNDAHNPTTHPTTHNSTHLRRLYQDTSDGEYNLPYYPSSLTACNGQFNIYMFVAIIIHSIIILSVLGNLFSFLIAPLDTYFHSLYPIGGSSSEIAIYNRQRSQFDWFVLYIIVTVLILALTAVMFFFSTLLSLLQQPERQLIAPRLLSLVGLMRMVALIFSLFLFVNSILQYVLIFAFKTETGDRYIHLLCINTLTMIYSCYILCFEFLFRSSFSSTVDLISFLDDNEVPLSRSQAQLIRDIQLNNHQGARMLQEYIPTPIEQSHGMAASRLLIKKARNTPLSAIQIALYTKLQLYVRRPLLILQQQRKEEREREEKRIMYLRSRRGDRDAKAILDDAHPGCHSEPAASPVISGYPPSDGDDNHTNTDANASEKSTQHDIGNGGNNNNNNKSNEPRGDNDGDNHDHDKDDDELLDHINVEHDACAICLMEFDDGNGITGLVTPTKLIQSRMAYDAHGVGYGGDDNDDDDGDGDGDTDGNTTHLTSTTPTTTPIHSMVKSNNQQCKTNQLSSSHRSLKLQSYLHSASKKRDAGSPSTTMQTDIVIPNPLRLKSQPVHPQADLIRILPCLHTFHASCCERWLTTKPFCAVCRSHVVLAAFHINAMAAECSGSISSSTSHVGGPHKCGDGDGVVDADIYGIRTIYEPDDGSWVDTQGGGVDEIISRLQQQKLEAEQAYIKRLMMYPTNTHKTRHQDTHHDGSDRTTASSSDGLMQGMDGQWIGVGAGSDPATTTTVTTAVTTTPSTTAAACLSPLDQFHQQAEVPALNFSPSNH